TADGRPCVTSKSDDQQRDARQPQPRDQAGATGAETPAVPEEAPALGLASTPASWRCFAVIGVGAPVSGSKPPRVFGNAMTSRIESAPESSMQTRSPPHAMPPGRGGPD